MTAKRVTTNVTIHGELPPRANLQNAILGDLRFKGKEVILCEIINVFKSGEDVPLTLHENNFNEPQQP